MRKIKKVEKPSSHKRVNLGGVFALDPNKLESEAIRQIELMEEYGELSAQACFRVESLEEQKKTLRSSIMLRNDSTPGKARNIQLAEALYRTDPTYIEVCKKLADAIYRRELLSNAMFTLAHRKDLIDFFNRRQLATNNIETARERVVAKTRKAHRQ